MKEIFADAVYWIATGRPNDSWHKAANAAKQQLGSVRLVTTDEVLTEFLTALSGCGANMRRTAAKMVRAILSNPNIRVVPQSRDSFQKGLNRYEARDDKQYSLQDCISMNVMEAEEIKDVLTNDHHFEQEGFTTLMQKKKS